MTPTRSTADVPVPADLLVRLPQRKITAAFTHKTKRVNGWRTLYAKTKKEAQA